jgi:CRP-like cAMP-binding protein
MTQPRPANKILAALPDEEFESLRPKLREVTHQIGERIYLPEQEIEYAYFINDGIVSWLATLEDGGTVEAGVIGSEGVAGVSLILGATSTPNEGLIQSALRASRISADDLRHEFRKNEKLNQLMLRFVHSMFTQVAQTAACNRLHTLDQRLARWLLMTDDRTDGNSIQLTQEFLSRMLGVRRAGVSVAANSLRQKGLIEYHRGDIVITDRRKMETVSCECYEIVKREYDEYLPG